MSQNKTIIPGFDYEASGNKEYDNSTQYDENAMSGLYSRSGADVNRTYIAGSPEMVQPGQGSAAQPGGLSTGALRQVVMQDRVVVGCLFSISRGLLGEIFPLYLGKNIIGRSPKCDVCLKEMTVSPAHAILHIRKDGSPAARYNVSVTDWESEYGTSVNNADARFDTLAVNENDVIKIGKHYKLLVKLFDTDAAGLDEDLEFEGMAEQPGAGTQQAGASQEPPAVSNDFYTPTRNDDNSTRTIIY